ncbi:hypothetical protein BZB76_2191 [Actinomadura pelletieri DSM 43383]|uniref:Uncharacterized protein n=1 Tax=Actinomadura pelletieri DSM 43383 TaxID=1120940 RepID=A0A495QTG8_9ACTN|nr:hypothetical protein [Actinomadura pelletieri]RKS76826.1 hypothetical protein BZB76_2191 [Actinomadura pelletieri DSM 43383]
MTEKPEKKVETTGKDREGRPPAEPKKPQKKKPGDAARKMREMFKG